MACPTCDHTMELVGRMGSEEYPQCLFHCPRCGTVRQGGSVYVPKLVERCRKFQERIPKGLISSSQKSWQSLGIAESIWPPSERGEVAK